MKKYEVVIGLEVHAELSTESKIYCSCRNAFGGEPNTQICPVCMGLPGALPTLNEKVIDYAVKMGHALNCRINSVSRLARKNYFYPDLPKAYQISQGDMPLCEHGRLDFMSDGAEKTVGITRIHIEEDAGKLLHDEHSEDTLVDLNRCGVPLIEIVTAPDIISSSEAKAFLDTVRNILRYLDISDCKMQEGSLRCDVNVSVREKGSEELGTRCEMKNVNWFSAAVRGIEYEARRQIDILESGGRISRETCRWDDKKGMSFIMRSKEDVQDYRFFTEPDLPAIILNEERIQALKDSIPELPNAKLSRYVNQHGIPYDDALLIVEDMDKALLYDECIALERCSPKSVSNWILGDISKFSNDTVKSIRETQLTAGRLADLIGAVEEGIISNSAAKKVLGVIINDGGEPIEIINILGLAQNSDEEYLEKLVAEVLASNEKSVADYKKGRTNALDYLVGQCMKSSQGRANPTIVRSLVENTLKK